MTIQVTDTLMFLSFMMLAVFLGNFIFFGLVALLKYIREEKEERKEESDLPDNNLVEFVGEDENGNGIYKLK